MLSVRIRLIFYFIKTKFVVRTILIYCCIGLNLKIIQIDLIIYNIRYYIYLVGIGLDEISQWGSLKRFKFKAKSWGTIYCKIT